MYVRTYRVDACVCVCISVVLGKHNLNQTKIKG